MGITFWVTCRLVGNMMVVEYHPKSLLCVAKGIGNIEMTWLILKGMSTCIQREVDVFSSSINWYPNIWKCVNLDAFLFTDIT